MTDKPENQEMANSQPVYDPPQALRMGDIHAGTGGSSCAEFGSAHQGSCLPGVSAFEECLNNGGAALNCNGAGSDPEVSGD